MRAHIRQSRMLQESDERLAARKRLPRLHPDHLQRSDSDADPDSVAVAGGGTESPMDADGDVSSRAELRPDSSTTRLQAKMAKHEKGRKLEHDGETTDDNHLSQSAASDESIDDDLKLSKLEQLTRWIQRVRQTFGTSFLLLVGTVYAVQGFKSFSALAINYFFKDNLKLDPAEAQTYMTMMMFPWGVKPIYGIVSDSLPIMGYHRKSYMIISSALGVLMLLVLSLPDAINTPFGAVAVLLLSNLSAAIIDVVIDARVVEMSRLDPKHGANDLQSVSWISMSIGGVLGSFLSGPATESLGVRGVFFFASVGPLTILALSLAMREAKSTVSCRKFVSSARKQLRQLKGAITTPVIWKCALWVFLSGAVSPSYSQVSFYFATDILKFTPEFLGTVGAFGYVFLLVGTLIYSSFFKDISFRRIFLIAQLSLAVVSMLDVMLVTRANLDIGIPDKAFVLGDAVIADVISRLKTMPVLVLCAKLCPKGVEGTLFALLMSISNFSYSVSEFWGAAICHWLGIQKDSYDNYWLAIVIRSVLKVTPIFFLFLIPVTDPQEIVDNLNFDENDDDEVGASTTNSNEDDGSAGTIRPDHTVQGSPTDVSTTSSMSRLGSSDALV